MAIKFSVAVRNARLNALETVTGASPILKIRTGAPPANCAAADSGTVLATAALPRDFMGDAVGGVISKAGTWEDLSAAAQGQAGHFRIYATDGTTCHTQGTVTKIGGGGDMTVDNDNVEAGQQFTVKSFAFTDGNG